MLIDEGSHRMAIIVPDDQLSLAIGRKGQNVRLASQLAGWELNIHSESRIQEIKDRAWASLSKVEGCNEFLIQTLYNHGIRSAEQLLDAQREFLMQFPGMSDENLDKILDSAKRVASLERADEERLRLEAEQATKAVNAGKRLQEILGLNAEGRMKRIRGLGEVTMKELAEAGINTVELLADADLDNLSAAAEINDKKAKQLKYAAMQELKTEKEIRDLAETLGVTVVDGVVRIPGQEILESPVAAVAAAPEEEKPTEPDTAKAPENDPATPL